jgi:hypothetical protein
MSVAGLLRWQWEGYARYHRSRANLLVHIVAVPLFLMGNVALVAALVRVSWLGAALGAAAIVASLAMQGRGHGREPVPPEPFTSPFNAVSRLFLEQWVTFPRFVLSGGWRDALRSAQREEP